MTHKICCLLLSLVPLAASAQPMPRYRWQNFTTADGLPDNRVFSVAVDGSRIWAGTENGLGLYENGKWKVFRPADGLAHRAVTYVAVDKKTHDVWAATMGGLSRYSAGRFDTFTQLVFSVAVDGSRIWAGTENGLGLYENGKWKVFRPAEH